MGGTGGKFCQLFADIFALLSNAPDNLRVYFCHQGRSGISCARDNVAVCANVNDEVFEIRDVVMRTRAILVWYYYVREELSVKKVGSIVALSSENKIMQRMRLYSDQFASGK